ncbi:DUF1707 domain-containing protein [Streptomyces pluripotens]|uniref:DUF1707 domain-containing protein n=1 Tax=Streptomyces pluripotens TaxID=1355015 RepID=A0A221P2I6_9ACTN|nr:MULTISPECIES: DUF1707 domain-containing protein [Streptomyces]ARP72038.1 hypothetical protein LK06_021115 [Streptomyces pluripotens]ASN26286.1 DUF1707 domain-containing protein [Streptomyces pluripotens]MCH0560712.1 DUF1707 domain-containing protein [Streptomyces sp. MUM 16J]
MTEQIKTSARGKGLAPAAGSGHEVLVSDEDRERAAERVRAAVGEGRLELGELDGRLSGVYRARTLGELTAAVHGLPEPTPRGRLVVDRAPTSKGALGLFGGFRRAGEWVVPPRFTAWSMWGGGRVDLTEARFAAQETEIRAVALWGATGIVVPDDIDVDVRGFGLFGLVGRRGARRSGRPGAPRVVVRAFALFGAVITKPKGE